MRIEWFPSESRPSRFPVRLKRETEWNAQIRISLLAGLLLAGLAAAAGVAVWKTEARGSDLWAACAFSGVFGLTGLLLIVVSIHQYLAKRIPETIVELDQALICTGKPGRLCICQRGPVRLKSLRANLVCLERYPLQGTNQTSGSDEDCGIRQIHTQNLLDISDLMIQRGEAWEGSVEFTLLKPERELTQEANTTMTWKIEVWGRVDWWPDFMHPFVVGVTSDHRPQRIRIPRS